MIMPAKLRAEYKSLKWGEGMMDGSNESKMLADLIFYIPDIPANVSTLLSSKNEAKKKRKVQHEYLMFSRTVTRHVYGNRKSSRAAVFRTGSARMQQLLPGFAFN